MSKSCSNCAVIKPLSCFGVQVARKDGLKSECKECSKGKRQALLALAPTLTRAKQRTANIKATYGISTEEHSELLVKSKGLCQICKSTNSSGQALAIDHCHSSSKVRGLLCNNCNLALGHFKDSLSSLENAIEYLKEFYGQLS